MNEEVREWGRSVGADIYEFHEFSPAVVENGRNFCMMNISGENLLGRGEAVIAQSDDNQCFENPLTGGIRRFDSPHNVGAVGIAASDSVFCVYLGASGFRQHKSCCDLFHLQSSALQMGHAVTAKFFPL